MTTSRGKKIKLMVLTKKEKDSLIIEIARYGEMAYRRGVQQGIALKVDEHTASILRHEDNDHVYQIWDLPGRKFKLEKKPLTHRLEIERVGSIIKSLIMDTKCPECKGTGRNNQGEMCSVCY